MTATLTTPDVTTETLPDFEEKCCIITSYPWGTGHRTEECKEPAKWVGFMPCCGNAGIVCEHHRWGHGPFRCGPCNRHAEDMINWRLLHA
jgi:hypothetical protein